MSLTCSQLIMMHQQAQNQLKLKHAIVMEKIRQNHLNQLNALIEQQECENLNLSLIQFEERNSCAFIYNNNQKMRTSARYKKYFRSILTPYNLKPRFRNNKDENYLIKQFSSMSIQTFTPEEK